MRREKVGSIEARDSGWMSNYRAHGSKDVPTQIKVVGMEAVERTGDMPNRWALRALLDDSIHIAGGWTGLLTYSDTWTC